MKKIIRLISILVILLVMFTYGLSYSQTAIQETLRIGASVALSGAAVSWGQPCLRTFQTQARLYNEAGGVKIGGKVYKIEIIAADDKFSAEGAAAAFNKLIFRDKVDYILMGGPYTVVALTGGPICTKNQVLYFCNGTAGPGLSAEWPWSFRPLNTEYERGLALLVWLSKNKPEIKRVAYVSPDSESGHASTANFLDLAKKLTKWENVAGEYFQQGGKDYYAVLTKVFKEKPDLICTDSANTGDTALIAKQSRELGFNNIIFSAVMHEAKTVTGICGTKAAENIYLPNFTYDITPEMKKLTDAYYKDWGEYNSITMFAADYLPVLIQAMQKSGSIDKFKVKDTLETGVFQSLSGPGARFYGKERYGIAHQWLQPAAVSCIHNGETELMAIVSTDELLRTMDIIKSKPK